MAGIIGIVSLKGELLFKEEKMFNPMLDILKNDKKQIYELYRDLYVFCATVLPLSSSEQDHLIINEEREIIIALEGYIFIPKEIKNELNIIYPALNKDNDYEYLPYLYKKYGNKILEIINGSYNLFLYDKKSGKCLLANDRLGFYPLYYYSNNKYLIFSSKIEGILSSGYMSKIEFDNVTFAEHLFFGYPITDNTYIKDVFTLPNATLLEIENGKMKQSKYWQIGDDYNTNHLSKIQSFEAINFALDSAIKKIASLSNKIACSITGGWDTRVVLSYLLPDYREQLYCYSFGSIDSLDIIVPQSITKVENLQYTPYILDNQYLERNFLTEAKTTIELSGGTRNYKRTHYLYAIKNLAIHSKYLLTGIFGDEVLKYGKPKGGTVINKNAVAMITSNFSSELIGENYTNSPIYGIPVFSNQQCLKDFEYRIDCLKCLFEDYDQLQDKYLAFRFEINLRKYFGNEASSYNDYLWCLSPFIDYEFIKTWLTTIYAGNLFPFKKPSLKTSQLSIELYTKLVMNNYPSLSAYPSTRGFSIADYLSLEGKLKIFYHKYIKKSKYSGDAFFTKDTDNIFYNNLLKNIPFEIKYINNIPKESYFFSDILSLTYWINIIKERYL